MADLPHTFAQDHVLRDSTGKPLGRVVLAAMSPYRRGERIAAVILTVSSVQVRNVKQCVFYADGLPYKVPADTPKQKISSTGSLFRVNNFYLEPVHD